MTRKGKRQRVANSFRKRRCARTQDRDSAGKFFTMKPSSKEGRIRQEEDYSDSVSASSSSSVVVPAAQQSQATATCSSALAHIMDEEVKGLMTYYRGIQSSIKKDVVSYDGKETIKKAQELCPRLFDFLLSLFLAINAVKLILSFCVIFFVFMLIFESYHLHFSNVHYLCNLSSHLFSNIQNSF